MKIRLLVALLFLLVVPACNATGGTGNSGDNPVAVVTGGDNEASPFQMLIASSDVTAADNRLVLTFWDGPSRLTTVSAVKVAIFTVGENNEAGEKVWEGESTPYVMGNVQYWVAYPTFRDPGNYGIQAFVTTDDGKEVENRALLAVKETTEAPATGDPVPATDTLTLDDVSAIEELSSAGPYVEDFYKVNIADAVTSGKVSVIAFATPGHCTSALCAPVLQTMSTVHDEMSDADINWVHIEIWRDFERQYMEPAVTEWKLPSEPWIFILNPDGTVGERLDGPVSVEELEQAINEVENGAS